MLVPSHLKKRASTAQIFLIDDEPLVLEMYATHLRKAGFQNLHCFSAAGDAIGMLRCLRPDLILTDIHMPETNGNVLTGLVREFEHLEPIPIIAVTGDDQPSTTDMVLGLGADSVLLKPVTQDELVGLVSAFVFATPVSAK